VEVLAITHFWVGAHLCWVNEFPCTHYWAWQNWYKAQEKDNEGLIARDDDVQKAMDKALA